MQADFIAKALGGRRAGPIKQTQPITGHCLWCQSPLPGGRRHGSAAKFCSPIHRQAFWKAIRRYGAELFDAGVLSIEVLKGDQQAVHAFSVTPQPSHVEAATI